ncbi:hypothetical protein P6144_16325 [Sphingomonas sp. HITSZ_GF]|uniref:DUF6894 family protein n=1 Tax=Sphingomonas sp. HITSZ_GF TaxID=3037247 RepID=UPI00240E77D0|nr:hypothetical protein [Sphingomonas sp. HITSZ_GF]MDG2535228.1 hypothetical protein [Sphingomonas sp. HITSZ_GF]
MRYFFHIQNGNGCTRDEEGQEFADLDAARQSALTGIRSVLGEELMRGVVDLSGRLDICDGTDRVLLSVPFGEAVQVQQARAER